MKRLMLMILLAGGVAPPLLVGCVPSANLPAENRLDADEKWEFQQALLADVDKVDTFIQKTQRGSNLPEMTVGWFAMILLNELCSQDQMLYDHMPGIHGNVEAYLRNAFQKDPKGEIVVIGAMARRGNTALRLAARHTLEMLVSIPDPREPPETQAKDRRDMLSALSRLRAALMQVVADSIPVQ